MRRPAQLRSPRCATLSAAGASRRRRRSWRASKSYRWFVVGSVCVGAFMGQVDSSITQMLLPHLELEFQARLSTVSWVAVAYLLAMAAFLPIFGRLADMVGRKLLYTGGFLLFVLGSGLCGLAPDLPVLIAFRIVQGIGAALLSSNSVAIVVAAAGPARRGRALGIQSAAQCSLDGLADIAA
jgi:MFS family permease